LVVVRREINFEIAPPFGGVDGITGIKERQKKKESSETGYRHDKDFEV
jgi:hypothetical protein